jgi:hypothetical protein
MIIKASQRAGENQLSAHLLNGETNEVVHLQELRGFVAEDLHGALQEVRALSLANKNIKKTMFSVSFNPPIGQTATVTDFMDATNRAEQALGLTGQQRAIVFHEKEGRRHAHVVWSRIDENLKAIKLPYYKKKLNDLSQELFLEHGWELPKGFNNKQERDLTSVNLSEEQTAKRQNLSAKEIKARIQAMWKETNDLASFKQALQQNGFALAKGSKRSFVLVDIHGDVRSLSRTLAIKAKEVKTKLGDSENLQTVDEAKRTFTQSHKEEYTRQHTALVQRHKAQLMPFKQKIHTLVQKHKAEREALDTFQENRQLQERNARQAQYQTGLRKVWQFVTGQYHQQKKKHEAEYHANLERDVQEKEELIQRQLKAREDLQQPLKHLETQHQSEMLMLNARFVQSMQELGIKSELSTEHTQSINTTRQHIQELDI